MLTHHYDNTVFRSMVHIAGLLNPGGAPAQGVGFKLGEVWPVATGT